MATQAERREFNKRHRQFTIKLDYRRVFPPQSALANLVSTLPARVTPMVQQFWMLACSHVLRLDEAGLPPPVINQQFVFHCFQLVSNPISPARAFKRTADPALADTYELYSQHLPPGHQKPDRPAFLTQASLHCCR